FRVFHISLLSSSEITHNPHSHQYYEIHLCSQGTYNYQIEGTAIPLHANQMLIIPPLTTHVPVSRADRYHSAVLSFSLSEKKGKAGFFRAFEDALTQHASHPVTVPSCLLQQLVAIEQSDWSGSLKSHCRLKAEISALILSLFETLGAFESPKGPGGLEHDREDVCVLLDNLLNNRSLSLKDIAERINYSERHTARLIQQTYHMSLTQLRRAQKESKDA
ncbi:MAG: AraC family ligand binding domain-containing protein, partial [Clostridia bacterium]|nr:AraC family ligand binding domain-containing protein [Clostridia bacterium]